MTAGGIIAIEEHYWDHELSRTGNSRLGAELRDRLLDFDGIRLREMDEAGVDMQVLSQPGAGTQNMEPREAAIAATGVNDRLFQAVQQNPRRFAAFATLPTSSPEAAADELERTVTQFGFKGAMINGLTNGEFIDKRKYWPIFARAQALDVPIYLHPAMPHPAVTEAYYQDYRAEFPGIITAPLAYTIEGHVQGVRFVLSRIFEEYPKLKIILGHFGEGIPFSLWRIDHTLRARGNAAIEFRKTFCEHFYVTTSGFFSDPALLCTMMEMGVDRILFSIDWPWGNNQQGVEWLKRAPLSDADRQKIFSGNAKALLGLA